jgi:surface antigen
MRRGVLFLAVGVLGALVAGCNGFGLGAASPPSAAATPAPGALPTGAALGGLLAGPVGAGLDEQDRQAAYDAQVAALDAGQRRTWRGAHGAYGFVEPGAEMAGNCRAYAQTIYIGGRPQRGHGTGCRQPDGLWRMTS